MNNQPVNNPPLNNQPVNNQPVNNPSLNNNPLAVAADAQVNLNDLTTLVNKTGLSLNSADLANVVKIINQIGLANLISISHSSSTDNTSNFVPQPLQPQPSVVTPNPDAIVINGTSKNDNIKGLSGDNNLFGNDGNDILTGGAGNDLLNGGSGNDTLVGGAGNDTLIGGLGKDVMTGSAGKNVFVFVSAKDSSVDKAGRDVITDFKSGQDKIDLSALSKSTVGVTVSSGSQQEIQKVVISDAGNYDAKDGNVSFQVTDGNYTYNIANFGKGDVINFPVGQEPLLKNTDITDGAVDLQYTSNGKTLTIHLSGLTTEQDAQLSVASQLNKVFGENTIVFGNNSTSTSSNAGNTPTTIVSQGNLALKFIGTNAFSTSDATGQVRFEKGTLYVSMNADANPEFAVDLTGVKTLTAADFIF